MDLLQKITDFVGAKKEDVFFFTSSGACAINHVFFATYLDVTRKTGKNHFLASENSEAACLLQATRLPELNSSFSKVPLKNGKIVKEDLIESITPRTALLSLSWADPVTGVIQPLDEIYEICQERGILLHVEASHVMGKGLYSWEKGDFLSFDGTSIEAPRGTGALFSKKALSPFILGDVINEELLLSFSIACQKAKEEASHIAMETALLREAFEERITSENREVSVLFQKEKRVPHISLVQFPKVSSSHLSYLLNKERLNPIASEGRFKQALSFHLPLMSKEEIDKKVALILKNYTKARRCSIDL